MGECLNNKHVLSLIFLCADNMRHSFYQQRQRSFTATVTLHVPSVMLTVI